MGYGCYAGYGVADLRIRLRIDRGARGALPFAASQTLHTRVGAARGVNAVRERKRTAQVWLRGACGRYGPRSRAAVTVPRCAQNNRVLRR
jgi:hypothetical protein